MLGGILEVREGGIEGVLQQEKIERGKEGGMEAGIEGGIERYR